MYINCSKIGLVDQSKNVHITSFANNHKLHKFAITNNNFQKIDFPEMHHCKTYMCINFHQIGLVDQSKPCTQICLQKRKLPKFATTNKTIKKFNYLVHKFVTTNNNIEKIIISDMHHRITYKYT